MEEGGEKANRCHAVVTALRKDGRRIKLVNRDTDRPTRKANKADTIQRRLAVVEVAKTVTRKDGKRIQTPVDRDRLTNKEGKQNRRRSSAEITQTAVLRNNTCEDACRLTGRQRYTGRQIGLNIQSGET